MRHVIPISGKDSCATAIAQIAREPGLDYELFFNDVGSELPETYTWLDKVELALDRKITRVGKSLTDVIYEQGILPSPHVRFCTKYAKIFPMEDWLGGDEATIYFGIRADEDRIGYKGERKRNLTPVYPLKEMGIGLTAVYQILTKHDLLPPTFFWKGIHDAARSRLEAARRASFPGTVPTYGDVKAFPQWLFDQLFAWRSRSNCYFCFFQRRYEWIGLLEHHPDLFAAAEKIEDEVGNLGENRKAGFSWVMGYPLRRMRRNAEMIKKRRVVQIVKEIRAKYFSRDPDDMLSLTGCGLFCGK